MKSLDLAIEVLKDPNASHQAKALAEAVVREAAGKQSAIPQHPFGPRPQPMPCKPNYPIDIKQLNHWQHQFPNVTARTVSS